MTEPEDILQRISRLADRTQALELQILSHISRPKGFMSKFMDAVSTVAALGVVGAFSFLWGLSERLTVEEQVSVKQTQFRQLELRVADLNNGPAWLRTEMASLGAKLDATKDSVGEKLDATNEAMGKLGERLARVEAEVQKR